MELKGNRLTISPLTLEASFQMRSWGIHENILFRDYNFPYENDEEVKKWFRYKTFTWRNKYFGIYDEKGRLVGYMGIKNKKIFRRQAHLGIVFDPDYINMGYGTEAMRVFLDYYFNELNMKAMLLEVAEFNRRASHLYEKLGFKPIAYYIDVFPDQNIDITHPDYLEEKSCFVFRREKIYNYIYEMKLTKERYISSNKGDEG